jgi:hypothetical protein
MDDTPSGTAGRSLLRRILISILWFIPIYLGGNLLVLEIVREFAGASTITNAAGAAFFKKYWPLVLGLEVAFTVALSWRGTLPGTGKFKKTT